MQQLSVSSLVRYLKNRLDIDDNLQKIYVAGELSNFHRHFSGHLYFTLKDEKAAISCVMFKSSAASLRFEPKNGDKVIVYANTSIFESSGQLQLYVQKMSLQGLGELYERYEALKKKLTEEGYFDLDHKKELSIQYPERIAILVGDKSAAMSDIRSCFARRWPLCKTDYFPVLVQGEAAAANIVSVLQDVDKLAYDAIILARGGGSFEDLFCFNDEQLVKTIYDLDTFLISGVGHEQDYTLTDFVADMRAPTPTAAVELITPDIRDVIYTVDLLTDDLDTAIRDLTERKKMELDLIFMRLASYQKHLMNLSGSIDNMVESIRKALLYKSRSYALSADHLISRMSYELNLKFNNSRLLLKRLNTLLEAYNAENVLKRGYTLVFQEGKLIKKRCELKNEDFTLKFIDGEIIASERK